MTTQQLYELADREIRLGTYDRELMRQCLMQANQIKVVAHQHYWKLRSAALLAEAQQYPDQQRLHYLQEVQARLNREEGSRRLRANLVGWAWVLVCFGSLCGAFIYFWAAKAAFIRGDPLQYRYGATGIVFVVLGIVAYVITKRDAGSDPFVD